MDRGGLWYRVLVARYGEEAGRLAVGSRRASSWWREIAKIRDGVGDSERGWFAERVSKVIGDGTNTLLWYDRWLGDTPLCRRFAWLFELASDKLCSVSGLWARGWGEEGDAWRWRRRLWTWEELLLGECRDLLANVFVQHNISDRWQWDPDPNDGFSVKGSYQILTSTVLPQVDETVDLV